MTLWKFLLLSEENQQQIIRLRGHNLKTRIGKDCIYQLYQLDSFLVKICKSNIAGTLLNVKYFDNMNEVNAYLIYSTI